MKPKIYIFSIFPWVSDLLHREHMLAKSFAKLGYDVTFVERSYRSLFKSSVRKEENIRVITVFGLPYLKGYLRSIFRLNDWIIGLGLRKYLDKNEDSWLILSSPLWAKAVAKFADAKQKYIYDISDNHLDFATNARWRDNLKRYEDIAIKRADFVSLTSDVLRDKLPKGKKYSVIENGVDTTASTNAKPILRERYTRKIVGFIGGVYKRVDLGLVEKCAKTYPEADFILVGPTDRTARLKELEQIPNIHYLGAVPWGQIQDYFASLDVGMIPFVSEKDYPWLRTVDSVKVYNYAAFGYPIVVTRFGQVDKLKPMVCVADSASEFVEMVGVALSESKDSSPRGERQKLAESHDWLTITKQLITDVLK